MSVSLAAVFLASSSASVKVDFDREGLAERLSELARAGASRWPTLTVDAETFTAYLGATLPAGTGYDALASLHAADFYIACACRQGDTAAFAAFDARFLSEVPRYLRTMGRGDAFAAEVTQLVREKLFVTSATGRTAKIADYNGLSPLGAWLRVLAVRTALSLVRKDKAAGSRGGDEVVDRSTIATPDPELDYFKARYRTEFREAFQAIVQSLDREQKTLLRLHYIDGLSIDELGNLFAVHRATAARWIATCRKKILEETKRSLSERLRMTASEIDSVMRLVQSELERGLVPLLTAATEG